MPVLPSFINYNKGKRKFKVPTKYPFGTRRPNTSALASTDIIDPHDHSTSQFAEGDEEFVSKGSLDFDNDERRYHYEPLDLNISPEPLMSSFPSRFLKNSYIQPMTAPRMFSDGEEEEDGGNKLGSTSLDDNGLDMEDDDADELIAKLQGMDASSFLGVPASPAFVDYNATPSQTKSLKKAKLAPIQIQTVGAYDTDQGTSQPHSQLSSPASSAVSGTTLARALISNTFVLSIDTRDSRKYRSGISTLTRTDSATLPMGDHPFLSSLRGKPSGEGLPWSSGSEDIPPVPPLPSDAELLILASKATSPYSGTYWRKNGDVRRHSSTGSLELMRSPEISAPVASSEIPITAVIDCVSASSVAASRRISRITVATTSTTSTHTHRDTQEDGKAAAAAALPDSPRSLPINLNGANGEAPKPLPPVPGSIPTFPNGAEEAVSPRDVIDYYSAFSPDVHQKGFHPAFSPITEVSETSGISPITSPFKIYSERSSFRPSPLSPEYLSRKDSQSQSDSNTQPPAHLPIRDTSRSSLASPVTNNRRYRYSTSFSFATSNMPVGSSIRETLKRRKRSGSAPNPIVVVQDPRDHDQYRVTISPDGVFGPSMRDSTAQTFPETPYSPIWSPLGATASSIVQLENDRNAHFPRTPESSSLPSFGNVPTSPSQAELMARAGSDARRSRQSSLTRNKDVPGGRVSQDSTEKHDVKNNDSGTSSSQVPDHSPSLNGPRKNPAAAGSSSLSLRSHTSSNDGYASTPPPRDATSKRNSITGSVNTVNSKHGEQHNRRQEASSTTDGEGTSNIGNIYFSISRNESHSSRLSPTEVHQNSYDSFQTPSATQYMRPLLTSDLSSTSLHDSTLLSMPTHAESAVESPPPYDTVFGDRLASDSRTPSTAGFDFPTNYRPPLNAGESPSRDSISGSLNNQRQRPRPRPRLPAGPRDRRDGRTISQSNRERNGSVSSVTSSGVTRASGAPPLAHSPHFNVPSPKFKGITLEAAKWTFTSAELQAIVSRAIQQSAEALSIRLLHLDTLDHDIPEDLHRLELERRDIQAKYRSLSHRRNKLLDTLSNGSLSQTAESPGSTLRIVEALRDVSTQLDRLAEDLHSVDEQLSRLNMQVLKHSGSALAMALRKLNKSFLEKLSELELVRHEVIQLEAERNEAIKQAEEAALKSNIASPPAQRRPSVRRFKAGFYSPSRPTSYHSNRTSISSILTANIKSPPGQEEIPPVPPIPPIPSFPSAPRRVPDHIRIDTPMRSANPLSTAGFTPGTSDSRTLLEQEALYVDIERHIGHRLRRSRSFAAFLPANDSSRRPRSPLRRNGSVRASRRPASLPGDSHLSDAYRAMNADSNAMLLTLRMLSDAV